MRCAVLSIKWYLEIRLLKGAPVPPEHPRTYCLARVFLNPFEESSIPKDLNPELKPFGLSSRPLQHMSEWPTVGYNVQAIEIEIWMCSRDRLK